MTPTERLMQIRAALKENQPASALYLLEQLISEQHLNVLYPEAEAVFEGVYIDTMGRLKVKPVDQKNECVHLCSCCKVME